LAQITEAEPNGGQTHLSKHLAENGDWYLCTGVMPWHGTDTGSGCGRHLRGSLRSASNVYFATVKSSIYLPRPAAEVPVELQRLLDTPPLSTVVSLYRQLGETITPDLLRHHQRDLLGPFSDADITKGLEVSRVVGAFGATNNEEADPEDGISDAQFRRPEYAVLRTEQRTPELRSKIGRLGDYDPGFAKFFSRVVLVDQLRETRALAGFSRVFPEGPWPLHDRKRLLFAGSVDWADSWLPAYAVSGEGLFFELDADRLRHWEDRDDVQQRAAVLARNYEAARNRRHLRQRDISPRFILLHTFVHVLMNQLTFECGYSSAALRERLYVAQDGAASMAAVLIYTAAGDAEGTMGGLVRMGKPGYLERVFFAALSRSAWCSADPVCMEAGTLGQGPDSCNLAACHNCCLVPETACEDFNRFLDRGLLVGALETGETGFFAGWDR
jgi:hypothetical protein